jgi:hypothetical protein
VTVLNEPLSGTIIKVSENRNTKAVIECLAKTANSQLNNSK